MGNIIWNQKKVLEFDDRNTDFVIDHFNYKGIKYVSESENIVIFPSLLDKALILKMLTEQDEIKESIESMGNDLINEGAAVICDEKFADKISLGYCDAQIIIDFSFGVKQAELIAYLPFESQKTSTSITKQVFRQLAFVEPRITYKVADTWDKLKTGKYWKYTFSSVPPTVVFEIAMPNLTESFLSSFRDVLVKSIIRELGYKWPTEGQEGTLEFLNDLNKSLIDEKRLSKEKQDLQEIAAKLECCESELDELKGFYQEAEAQLEKIKIDTGKVSLEELEGEKSKDIEEDELISHEEAQTKPTEDGEKIKARRNRRKRSIKQTNKSYLPMNPERDNSRRRWYQQLPRTLTYPGKGPVHQFERPRPDTQSAELPPNFIEKSVSANDKKTKENSSNQTNKNAMKVNNIYSIMYPKGV
ncbi:hypothetical protein Amet_3421 [Alkaliphilus metalliredigens QYMF]|uniref:Uncharacterized protein n=1 Tax=Alkaliphilus metalliredigens (strain QYMF) TaxID=293826 RepID=A6TTN1_ALKMQ|nr:hypothetical protein [Alkaliphilus metalliredigens]ABR49549.1 hypothetical protein Amet_3421 [Alkaliphilus metalliredigens QYMF]